MEREGERKNKELAHTHMQVARANEGQLLLGRPMTGFGPRDHGTMFGQGGPLWDAGINVTISLLQFVGKNKKKQILRYVIKERSLTEMSSQFSTNYETEFDSNCIPIPFQTQEAGSHTELIVTFETEFEFEF